tara:strand:- start:27032 stop:28474 length:1443 start_codon:yes stop_codon:yes gene_type:complete
LKIEHYGILSLLAPLGALVFALWKKQIYLALLFGSWLGCFVLNSWNPFFATTDTIETIIHVFSNTGNTRIIIYSLAVGGTLTLITATGGVRGFIHWLEKRKWVKNATHAQLVPFLVGLLITIESSITSLIAGTIGRPLTDQYKISREKLAYICDSTSAPICILIPFNGWGAFIVGLLSVQGITSPVSILFQSIAFNFYPIVAIMIVFVCIIYNWNIGPMSIAETRAKEEGKLFNDNARPLLGDDILGVKPLKNIKPKAYNLVAPLITMVLVIIIGIYVTGRLNIGNEEINFWNIIKFSSGSTAVLWSVIMSLIVIAMLNIFRDLSLTDYIDFIIKGMAGMIPVVTLLVLAFSLGDVVRELGTGVYIAGIISNVLNIKMATVGLFIISCLMAFSTGTSWGTFAVMIPIAIPMAIELNSAIPMFLGAVLGGGIFGDHCSPISDTTIISSMASGSDHIDHVRTQMPYAIIGGTISISLYFFLA